MLKNLAAVGLNNVAHAGSIAALNRLLAQDGQDYRGIVLTMIHKFRDMPANLNTRRNIYILIEELNKILDRAVNLKNFLKGKERVPEVARFVADHFRQNVEPLGYKAFLVAVDREACALYKEALAFDSDEINAIVKDIGLLKQLFKAKMETKAPAYLALVTQNFNDKDVDNLIDHFRDPERRKAFFKEYKEIEMLYEIISPDAFLRPFLEDYATLSGIYGVARNAYARRVYVDRAFQKKTNELVQRHIGTAWQEERGEYVTLDRSTIKIIKMRQEGKATKVINLIKSIEKSADENSDDPFLIAMAERARAVQESFEERQTDTEEALADLLAAIDKNEQRKREQAAKGLDALTYFVLLKLTDEGIPNPEAVSRKVREAFVRFSNWKRSEAELREQAQSGNLRHLCRGGQPG